ncbi:MAG: hypothetical protein ABSF15_28245 [Candidatus Sulfotelmatobacter sp.]|jgi:hypothetical protein
MSIRIHNDVIAAAAPPPPAPAENAARAGASTLASSVAGSSGDQVEISSFSGNVATSVGALAEQQGARVSHLAALYARGDYQVDSMQTSRALISGAIASSPIEEDR